MSASGPPYRVRDGNSSEEDDAPPLVARDVPANATTSAITGAGCSS